MQESSRRPEGGQWQLDRSVSITHIITTISAIAAMIGFGSNLSTRQELTAQALAQSVVSQQAVNLKQDQDMNELRKSTREDLRTINEKLDRLIVQRAERP